MKILCVREMCVRDRSKQKVTKKKVDQMKRNIIESRTKDKKNAPNGVCMCRSSLDREEKNC